MSHGLMRTEKETGLLLPTDNFKEHPQNMCLIRIPALEPRRPDANNEGNADLFSAPQPHRITIDMEHLILSHNTSTE